MPRWWEWIVWRKDRDGQTHEQIARDTGLEATYIGPILKRVDGYLAVSDTEVAIRAQANLISKLSHKETLALAHALDVANGRGGKEPNPILAMSLSDTITRKLRALQPTQSLTQVQIGVGIQNGPERAGPNFEKILRSVIDVNRGATAERAESEPIEAEVREA